MLNTSLCYIEKDGCWLMQHRVKKKNDLNHEKWVGVGGKFEEGETPEECVLREAEEETGLKLDSLSYRGIITFLSDRWEGEYMHLFTSDRFHGELSSDCSEGDLVWVKKEDVFALPIWEGDKLFLSRILSDGAFFTMKLVYEGDRLVGSEEHEYGESK